MDLELLEKFCKMGHDEFRDPIGISYTGDGVLSLIDNNADILGVAYIGEEYPEEVFFSKNKKVGQVWSPVLRQRLGAHILINELPALGVEADILIVSDNSLGSSNADVFFGATEYNWMFSFDLPKTGVALYEYENDHLVAELQSRGFVVRDDPEYAAIEDLWFMGVAGFNFGNGILGEGKFANLLIRLAEKQMHRFVRFYRALAGQMFEYDPADQFDNEVLATNTDDGDIYDFSGPKSFESYDDCSFCDGIFPSEELVFVRGIGDGVWLCNDCLETNGLESYR